MNKKISYTVFLLSFLILFPVQTFSQGKSVITPYIKLQYFKNTDDRRFLQTVLTYSKNRMEIPLPAMEISFYKGSKKELIATGATDNKGIAKLELRSDMKLPVNSDGTWTFSSEYKGNDTVAGGTSEVSVKDVRLEMALTLVDSVKTISINALTLENGKDKPVSGEVVKIYVPRMFSVLPIGEVTLDEKGLGTLEFPSDLPGDKEGNLTVIARIEENQTFGNIEKQFIIKWGIPTQYSLPTSHRALWTKTPPLWMIYTLSILLAGVWGHYLFAIISLIRIRLDAKKKEPKKIKVK
jgi:hypothetical protein